MGIIKLGLNRTIKLIGLNLLLLTIYSCSDNRNDNSTATSEFLKSFRDEKLVNELVDRYLPRLNAQAKADFDSTALIVKVGLDSSSTIEAFRPFWVKQISELRTSDSLDYIFYDSLFKKSLIEHVKHRRFPDSIKFFNTEIEILENKIDSAKRGLFGNPVIAQLTRLSNEKGVIYFLSTDLSYGDDKNIKLYFGIEEMEQDTIISWTSGKSLAKYMGMAIFRRNTSYWTKGLEQQKKENKEKTRITAANKKVYARSGFSYDQESFLRDVESI
jgi:hypothetical protein